MPDDQAQAPSDVLFSYVSEPVVGQAQPTLPAMGWCCSIHLCCCCCLDALVRCCQDRAAVHIPD